MSDHNGAVQMGRRMSQAVSDEDHSVRQHKESDGTRNTQQRGISKPHEPHLNSLSEASRRESRRTIDARRPSQLSLQNNLPLSQRRASQWHRRPSVASSSHRQFGNFEQNGMPRMKYENTYQVGPNDNQRFKPSQVEPIVSQILQSFLDGEQYDARQCAQTSKHLSDVIKARVREFGLSRHKLVCSVVIGQVGGQTVRCASRCVWDGDTDGYATATFQNSSLFASATVFAVYFE